MVSAASREKATANYSTPWISTDLPVALMTCLIIGLLVSVSLYRQTPPAAVSAGAPLGDFSSGRAMKHLVAIAQKPHPIGSQEHARVRDYIFTELQKAGLTPEIQKTTGINAQEYEQIRAASVENIVATLPGTANTKPVVLVGHYDSAPNGPGASDDGAAIAMMLETLRTLKTGSPLKNDVIFLFTDGEEAGLLGAYAFVAEHPVAKNIGLVLNFEARGNGGPVIMFETSNRNGSLISQFASAAPYPVGHSLAYEIYRLMPNSTDLTVFKRAQVPGLNFAYINGLSRYHTQLDNVNEIDERSLQHEGSTALALTRRFGDVNFQDPRQQSATNAVYFDVLGLTLVHYSSVLIFPLTIAVVLLFALLIVIGFKRGRLTLSGIALGFLAFIASLIAAPVLMTLVWNLVQKLREVPGVRSQGEAYDNNLYLISFVAGTIAVTSVIYILFRKRVSGENLIVGGLVAWLILLIGASVVVPGASYLLTWPLLLTLPALLYAFTTKARSFKLLLLYCVGAALGIILWVPVIYQTFIGLTLNSIGVVMAMVVLLLGLLIPHLNMVAASNKWLLPAASAALGLAFIVAAGVGSGYDARRPRFDTMFYGLNADTGKAVWASADAKPDSWTTQFLAANFDRRPLTDVFSSASARPFLQSVAPAAGLAGPRVEVLDDVTQGDVRALRLRVNSSRQAPLMTIYLESPAEVMGSTLNGKPVKSSAPNRHWVVRYYAVPEDGLEIALELKSAQPLKLRVVDQTYGLPEGLDKTWQARPAGVIAAPLPFNDSTFVSKSFVF